MRLNRFALAFLTLLPFLAQAATPTVPEVSQLFRQGKHAQALERIDSFLGANPKDAQGRFLKGLILTELNRIPEAIKVFSDLTDDYPELPEPYNNLAVLYAAQGQYERAKNSLEMAIRTHPSYATAHENLGDIYAKMASLAYDKALQLDQSNASAQTKIALIKDLFGPVPASEAGKGKLAASKPAAGKASTPPAAKAEVATRGETAAKGDPPARKDSPTGANAPAGDPRKAIEQALLAWAKAWSSQNVNQYIAAYTPDYAPAGSERAAWEAQRRERLTKPARIKVEVDEFDIEIKDNKARASFRQRYESDRHRDLNRKTLGLELRNGAWLISEER